MKNSRQQDNERRAAMCRGRKGGRCLKLAEVCAQCSVRPGRPGCVLFGSPRGYYDAPEPSDAAAWSPDAKVRIDELVAQRNWAELLIFTCETPRKDGAPTARGHAEEGMAAWSRACLTACRPAAMPDDMGARLLHGMRQAERRAKVARCWAGLRRVLVNFAARCVVVMLVLAMTAAAIGMAVLAVAMVLQLFIWLFY